jgi:hypothetical protein
MKGTKRVLATILTLAMMLSLVSVASAAEGPFVDVAANHEAAASFGLLKEIGVYKGYPDGTAAPDSPITRAEFAAVVCRMLNREKSATAMAAYTPTFPDANETWAWAYGYVNVASSLGIIKGYEDGTFRPQNNVTFAEAFAMLVRALKLDKAAVGVWPANYMLVAAHIGLDKGLDPVANLAMTRGEMAVAADNGVKNEWKWNTEKEDLEKKTGSSLLQTHWEDLYADATAKTVKGVFERVTITDKIRVSGVNYDKALVIEVVLNGATAALTNLQKDDEVVLTLDDKDKVKKIVATRWTIKNGKLTAAALSDKDDPTTGTVTITDSAPLNVDSDSTLILNGTKVNLGGLKATLEAFIKEHEKKTGVTLPLFAVVNARVSGSKMIELKAATTDVVTGTVTGTGADQDGAYILLAGDKIYTTLTLVLDDQVKLLLDFDGKAAAILEKVTGDVKTAFVGHVIEVKSTRKADGTTVKTVKFNTAGGVKEYEETTLLGGSTPAFGDVVIVGTDDGGKINQYRTTGDLLVGTTTARLQAGTTGVAKVLGQLRIATNIWADGNTVLVKSSDKKLYTDKPVTELTKDMIVTVGFKVDGVASGEHYAQVIVVDTTAPTASSALAANRTGGTAGTKEAGDTVTITFSKATNQPTITNANINTVLALSAGKSWLDGAGAIGSAVWTSATVLTITLSGGGTPAALPTVAIGDVITPSSAITDLAGNAATGTVTITGAW